MFRNTRALEHLGTWARIVHLSVNLITLRSLYRMMSSTFPELDPEAVESAFQQIHYYMNVPLHVKSGPNKQEENIIEDTASPAHVVNREVTVTMGKVNIPTVSEAKQFLRKTITQ